RSPDQLRDGGARRRCRRADAGWLRLAQDSFRDAIGQDIYVAREGREARSRRSGGRSLLPRRGGNPRSVDGRAEDAPETVRRVRAAEQAQPQPAREVVVRRRQALLRVDELMKVALFGVTGRMGQTLLSLVAADSDLQLAGGTASPKSESLAR